MPPKAQRVSCGRAWYAVLLLTLLFAVSLVDRFILALLARPVSHDLGLSDTQMGLLIGTGFAILYALAGIPIAHGIDGYDRRKIVAFGAILWSCTTIISAFARSFDMLLLLRAGVAIGEAVLTPAAVSIIADLFPQQRRALPMSIYLSCGAVMGMGSFAVGGAAIDLATMLAPGIGFIPWRLTLILIGLPGVALGLITLLTVREPDRTGVSIDHEDSANMGSFIAYLVVHGAFYFPFFLAGGLYCLFGYSIVTWLPTILVRGFAFTPAHAGYTYGSIGVPVGLAGMFFWPRFAIWIERRRPYQGAPVGLLIASLCGIPLFAMTTALSNIKFVLIGVAGVTFLASAWSILPPLCIQTFGPSRMRARLVALNLLALNLLGLGVGPVLTVWCGRFWGDEPQALGYGLAVVGVFAGVGAVLCYVMCLGSIGRLQAMSVSLNSQ